MTEQEGENPEEPETGHVPEHDAEVEEEDRLPWLDSADDYDEGSGGSMKTVLSVIGAVILLAAVIGGLYWWQTNRTDQATDGDGEVIAAADGDFKEKPEDPQGKEFEGEGDASFAASEGKTAEAAPAKDEPEPAKKSEPAAKQDAKPKADAPSSGPLVQLGSYASEAKAQEGWRNISGRHAFLKGLNTKIVKASVEGSTVYRLNVVAADAGKANSLCGRIKNAGSDCIVVR